MAYEVWERGSMGGMACEVWDGGNMACEVGGREYGKDGL